MDGDTSFLGTGWSFPPAFAPRGTVAMASAEDDIAQSLRILLSTTPGERVMQPSFGCGLKSQVYQVIDASTVTVLLDLIRRAILFFEPRVRVESITADSAQALEGRLDFHIGYTIISANTRHNLVYPFYFREGTDVPA